MSKGVNCMSGRCRFADRIYAGVIEKCGKPNSIIELGCGNGLNLRAFIGVPRKVGIDPFEPNVILAKKNNPDAEIFLDCHLRLKGFANKEFDVGITCSVLDHIENYEVALDELLRICKALFLIEPTIEGENRQALPSETVSPSDTWYFNYRNALVERNLKFTMEPTPLYKKNSGLLYHTICVDCGE